MSKNERVTINCGGQCYDLFVKNIIKHPNTLLGELFLKKVAADDVDGYFYDETNKQHFFDRNGRIFETVADFYRTGKLRARTDIPVEQVVDELEYFKIEHAAFAREHAEKLAEAAKRREAQRAAAGDVDDANNDERDEDDDVDAAAAAAEEEEEIDEFEAARAHGSEAMFNVGYAKIWNSTSRREITKGRNLLLELVKQSNIYAAEDAPKPLPTPATNDDNNASTNNASPSATANDQQQPVKSEAAPPTPVLVVVEVPTDIARCLFPLALAHYRLGDTNATEKWLARAEAVLKHAVSLVGDATSSTPTIGNPQTPTKAAAATVATPTKYKSSNNASNDDRRSSLAGIGGGGGKRIAALAAANVVPADAVRTLRLVVSDSRDASMKLSIIVGVALVTAGLFTAWRYNR